MIQMYHVSKVYPGGAEALKDVTFQVNKGEFAFLTGPSGAGKTTLLKLIYLGERATKGQIIVDGRNVLRLSRRLIPYHRRQIGIVFQDFKLIPDLTALENIALVGRAVGLSPREVKRKGGQLLSWVGMGHRQHTLVQRLSGGEQQRVAIARGMVNDPPIILADEPTGNLDPQQAEEIMKLFLEANAKGALILVATHDQHIMERLGRRILHLEAGCIQKEGEA
jgi:cell division transport system ATP-binding protein